MSFREGMRELGYVEGQNIAFEFTLRGRKADRLPELAPTLVLLKVDEIVAPLRPRLRWQHSKQRATSRSSSSSATESKPESFPA
jgi:hypothetical protein